MKKKIFIAGHNGMVGTAILKLLKKKKNIKLFLKNKKELDLRNQKKVQNFFKNNKIDEVYIAAARVGGIYANNNYPANFIYDNIIIQANIIDACFKNNVKKILLIGSSCIYPKFTKQPISEEQLLSGKLEETNEPYAVSKICGIKLCESYNRQYGKSHKIDYRTIMPSNLYGFGDNFHELNSHVIPSLIKKFDFAKKNKKKHVVLWGTGKSKREFLFVDDLAKAAYLIMNISKKKLYHFVKPMQSHVNVGYGKDITIKNLANLIKKTIGYKEKIIFDNSKTDGTKRKLLNCKIINKLGWKPSVSLEQGLSLVYKDFKKKYADNI